MRINAYGLCVLTLLVGCLDPVEPDVGEVIAGVCMNEDTNSEVEVSFENDLLPKLRGGCGCHNPIMGGSSIDTTGFSVGDHAAVLRGGVQSRDKAVLPGDPCGSALYQKLTEAPPYGARMPLSGPYWSRTDMAMLHDWIAEGAHAK